MVRFPDKPLERNRQAKPRLYLVSVAFISEKIFATENPNHSIVNWYRHSAQTRKRANENPNLSVVNMDIVHRLESMQARDPPWLWNLGQTSPEVSGLTKKMSSIFFEKKFRFKVRKDLSMPRIIGNGTTCHGIGTCHKSSSAKVIDNCSPKSQFITTFPQFWFIPSRMSKASW